MTTGSLMKVEGIAECSLAFCNTFALHQAIIGLEKQFLVFLSGHFRQILLYFNFIVFCGTLLGGIAKSVQNSNCLYLVQHMLY